MLIFFVDHEDEDGVDDRDDDDDDYHTKNYHGPFEILWFKLVMMKKI